jgi:hypothetical protein
LGSFLGLSFLNPEFVLASSGMKYSLRGPYINTLSEYIRIWTVNGRIWQLLAFIGQILAFLANFWAFLGLFGILSLWLPLVRVLMDLL